LEAALYDLYEGEKSVADFAPYLCDRSDIKLSLEKKEYVFAEFASALKKIEV
jgi:hypothetical protein